MNRSSILCVALLMGFAPAFSFAEQSRPYHGPHMWDGAWHGWFLGPIMMIFFVALAVVVAVLMLRWLGALGHSGAPSTQSGRNPLDVLKERYAKGEIDTKEFEERRQVLGKE